MTATIMPVKLRGETVVARQVIQKIAAQAAREVSAVSRPKVVLDEFRAGTATVAVQVEVPYPVPLRRTADQLRARVIDRLDELAGVRVRRVDVDLRWAGATAVRRVS